MSALAQLWLHHLAPPIPGKVAHLRMQRYLLVTLWLSIAGALASITLNDNLLIAGGCVIMIVVNAPLLQLTRKGQLTAARIVTPLTAYVVISYFVLIGYGLHSVAVAALPLCIMLAALVGGRTMTLIYGVLCTITLLTTFAFASPQGLTEAHPELADLVSLLVIVAIFASLLWTLTTYIDNDRNQVSQDSEALLDANTQLKVQRSALDTAQSRYRILAENATDFIWTCDLDLRFTYCSPSCKRVTGYSAERLLDRPALDIVLLEEHETLVSNFSEQLQVETATPGSVPAMTRVITLVRADGSTIATETHLAFVTENGVVTGIMGSSRDIQERLRLEAERRDVSQQLRQAQKMESVGQLAGGVAHDFNNVLLAIQGYTDLLRTGQSEAELDEFIAEIQKASDRAAALTRQLLTFSRQQDSEHSAIDVKQLIADLRNMLLRLIPENITFAVDLPGDALPRVSGDKGQLEQLIVNLAINARDAIEHSGTIRLSIAHQTIESRTNRRRDDLNAGDYLKLTVTDDGHGMEREVIERIFEPFFSTKEHGQGTGLGMTVVKGIVADHHGWIDIQSQPGQGTTVEVLLPVLEHELSQTGHALEPTASSGAGQRVMLVEDEEQVRNLVSLILRRQGYDVIEAKDGAEGLAMFQRQRDEIDLILSDIVMPEMGGQEMMQEIRRESVQTPFVFMSGYSENPGFVTQAGAGFVQKPFSADQLVSKIEAALKVAALAEDTD